MEDTCEFVNSRGLLKSCVSFQKDIRSSNPHIRNDILNNVKDGDSVYVCTTALPMFANSILPTLDKKIVLVSGDADESIPGSEQIVFNRIVESPYILKWFAQNCLVHHEKLVHLPIGIYYHDYYNIINGSPMWTPLYKSPVQQEEEIIGLIKRSAPFWERKPKCYTTFHFQISRGDRREAYNSIGSHLIDYERTPVSRLESHSKQLLYSFVVSPFGGGPDCHRTWEALVLGCIPIIHSSNMDPVFSDLPVLLVNSWSDVTQELLNNTITEFRSRSFNYGKLTLKYWRDMIHAAGDSAR